MAAPTSYTEATLKTYIQVAIKATGSQLNFTDTDYTECINDTLLAYGVTDIANATSIKKLRTLARREAFRMVMQAMVGSWAFTSDAYAFSPKTVYDKAMEMYKIACAEAMEYDAPTVEVVTVEYSNDLYKPGFDFWDQ